MLNRMIGTSFLAGLVLVAAASPGLSWAKGQGELQDIVDASAAAVKTFAAKKDDVDALLERSSGVVIYPDIKKGAFAIGGEGGTGVLVGRNKAGEWSNPAFMTYGAISYGLQAGVESSTILMIVMNEKTMQSLAGGKIELGTNATIAAGEGMKGKLLSTDRLADIYYFVHAEGVFAGLNLKGGANEPRDKYNKAYYGKDVSAKAVVIDQAVESAGAAGLIKALSR